MRDDYYALCFIHAKLTKRHRCLVAALRQSIKQQFVCFSCSSNTQYRAKPTSPKLKLCVRKKTAISDINSSFLVGTLLLEMETAGTIELGTKNLPRLTIYRVSLFLL